MEGSKAAWDAVGAQFSQLGERIKERCDARVAFGDDQAKLEDAVKSIVETLDNAFTAIGDTLRDQEIHDELKAAATAMGSAFTTTFHEVADEVKKRFAT
ncbi:MAG: hypothetical protein ACT4OX_16600 [Actinomycetota bacterium]